MSNIQETIVKAVMIRGGEILRDKQILCNILEDLSPDLYSTIAFINKMYTNEVGEMLFKAYSAGAYQGNNYVEEAERILEEEEDRGYKSRKEFFLCFEQVLFGENGKMQNKERSCCLNVLDSDNQTYRKEREYSQNTMSTELINNVYNSECFESSFNSKSDSAGRSEMIFDDKRFYRETIRKATEAQGKYKEMVNDNYEYGVVQIRFEPFEGNSFIYENTISDGSIPDKYFPVIEHTIIESAKSGVVAGFPLIGVKATLYGGMYHPVNSSKNAFKQATKQAFIEGIEKAYPVVCEAVGIIKIVISNEDLKQFFNDLNKKRGRVIGNSLCDNDGQLTIEAEIPLSDAWYYKSRYSKTAEISSLDDVKFEKYVQVPQYNAKKRVNVDDDIRVPDFLKRY